MACGPRTRWPTSARANRALAWGVWPIAFDGGLSQTLLGSWVQFSAQTSRPAFGRVNASVQYDRLCSFRRLHSLFMFVFVFVLFDYQQLLVLWFHHPTVLAKTLCFQAVYLSLSSIRSSRKQKLLLPQYLMNGLSNLDDIYRQYSLAPNDLIRFCRSKVKVTAGCLCGEGIHFNAGVLKPVSYTHLTLPTILRV